MDTKELRRLAQAATPGPWKNSRAFELGPISDADDQSYGIIIPIVDVYGDNKAADIAYIAAANPAAVSDILDRLEVAEKERDALRSKIAQMEKRLRLILEEPENTLSNSKALRECIRQAKLALEESK